MSRSSQNPYDNIYGKYYFYLDLPKIRVGRARKPKDQLGVALRIANEYHLFLLCFSKNHVHQTDI